MVRRTILIAVALALAGCGTTEPRTEYVRVYETVDVLVEVPVKREPPAELAAPYHPDALPRWLPATDPAALSCLSADGERDLKLMIHDLLARDRAWKEWAAAE